MAWKSLGSCLGRRGLVGGQRDHVRDAGHRGSHGQRQAKPEFRELESWLSLTLLHSLETHELMDNVKELKSFQQTPTDERTPKLEANPSKCSASYGPLGSLCSFGS